MARSSWSGRTTTGVRLFVYLVVALLPLALIAIVATLQSSRAVDLERRALLRIATTESARAIGMEIVGDLAVLRSAAGEIAASPDDGAPCARVTALLAPVRRQGGRFGIIDNEGRALCGEAIAPHLPDYSEVRRGRTTTRLVGDRGIFLATAPGGPDTGIIAKLYLPAAQLAAAGRPTGDLPPYELSLLLYDRPLFLAGDATAPLFSRSESVSLPLALNGLAVKLRVVREPLSASALVALLTPLFMWIAAALIAWLVVDRLLLRPLGVLRQRMAGYRPGARFQLAEGEFDRAVELRDLAQVFTSVTRVVATHEAGLARGLEHQTRLTREVHHRVKNNLQVIASLISLHARGARGQEAQRAYTSIQRRVDALAVVHRHHFAEAETTRGVPLRAVLGELTANIRSGAAATHPDVSMQFTAEPLFAGQDIAIALSFLATELVELALQTAPGSRIEVTMAATDTPGRATMRVASAGLRDSARLARRLEGSVARVLEGLSRQLRAPLARDADAGSYTIEFSYLGRD